MINVVIMPRLDGIRATLNLRKIIFRLSYRQNQKDQIRLAGLNVSRRLCDEAILTHLELVAQVNLSFEDIHSLEVQLQTKMKHISTNQKMVNRQSKRSQRRSR